MSSFLSTAFKLTVISGILVGVLLCLFSGWLSMKILMTPEYQYVFILFGLTVVFYGLNSFLIAVVNGHKAFKNTILSIF
ncbi:hypothetical protein [Chitinophaga sedimenti]|uniref:hypothetical protein n=1 Tax=Chitinophaga sedimenti TaxID=2033606 RepID=UPI003559331A